MIVFLLGSLICSLSPTIVWLGVGRFLEGMAAGTVFMMMIPTLILSFPAGRPNRVLAVLVIGFFGSVAMGPFLGSLTLLEDAWRWLFVAVGLLALAGALMGKTLPKTLTHRRIKMAQQAALYLIHQVSAHCSNMPVARHYVAQSRPLGALVPAVQYPCHHLCSFLRTIRLGRAVDLQYPGAITTRPDEAIVSNHDGCSQQYFHDPSIGNAERGAPIGRSIFQWRHHFLLSQLATGSCAIDRLMTVFHDRVGPGVLGIAGSLCLMNVPY